MRMVSRKYWTAEMVRELPDDGKRYECVHGELFVSPSPRPLHQLVLARLALAVGNYLEREPVGVSLHSPADISWGPDILVQPDLYVVDLEQARAMSWPAMQRLVLAVEVLSPSSVRADRFAKRVLYLQWGVESYWVVDADTKSVEVWTPGAIFPVTEEDALPWKPAGAGGELVIGLEELFRPI